MADFNSQSPAAATRASDGDFAAPPNMTKDSEREPSLPPLPTDATPAGYHDSPRSRPDNPDVRKRVDDVLQSEIGVNTLLNRLRQSIASARDLSSFLKERSALEERHAKGLEKLCRGTQELIRRPDSRQGSFAHSYGEMATMQNRVADHGVQFAMSLHQMSDDLHEMASNAERGRKQWKHTGLTSEQRYQDAETASGKAKAKYETLAEQYDRARTGDRQSGRFGLKTKSAAQQEEDLNRKVQVADTEYGSKVQAAQASRQELVNTLRPQAIRALTELITECDSAVALQLQRFASLNERLILGNGLCISPLKTQPNGMASEARSQRDVINAIDNEKDVQDYISSFYNKLGPKNSEIKYEKHPALLAARQPQPPPQQTQQSFGAPTNLLPSQDQLPQGGPGTFDDGHRASSSGQVSGTTAHPSYTRGGSSMYPQQGQYPSGPAPSSYPPPHYTGGQIPQVPSHSPATMHGSGPDRAGESPPDSRPNNSVSDRTGSAFHRTDAHSRSVPQFQPYSSSGGHLPHNESSFGPGANTGYRRPSEGPGTELPPLNPVFGVTLDELFRRDGTAVPSVVQQCIATVEAFGLDTEGIYRTSGSNPVMMELKAMFDHDSSRVDLSNPAVFQDVSAVTTLLKHFLRSLPDPLLTSDNYTSFMTAAQIDDDIHRRDSLHAIINDLPDPHYATLRQLALHLNKVAGHAQQNLMTARNLAIVIGPTLIRHGPGQPPAEPGDEVVDAGLQARVVETIILSTFQIFDDEE